MKKFFTLALVALFISKSGMAQDSETSKKFRAGLKFSAEPGWFTSGNTNTIKDKAGFGYGFGLVLDFRLSDVIYLSTGIGGDFENASVKYRNDGYDPYSFSGSQAFCTQYIQDNSNNFVKAENDVDVANYLKQGNSFYTLSSRKIKTTHITIPISLKMLTKEFSGFRYFGQFGGEIGIRSSVKSDDTYAYKETIDIVGTNITAGGTNTGQNISKDASTIPMRVGLNVGLGAEYRMAGSTSLFLSVNYFRSFTNLMRNDSYYNYTSTTVDSNGKVVFTHLSQNLIMSSIRINIGIMF